MGAFHRPSDLDAALRLLAGTAARPLAGGTDLYPWDAARTAWGEPGIDSLELLDLSALRELSRIEERGSCVEIGALVTWSDASVCSLPPWFDAVRAAAREVGGAQIQNRGTIAGNLCNASPAADGVPPLLALDARMRLRSVAGTRELPLSAFILGNRRTALRPGELLTHIVLPKPASAARSVFLKLGARRYLVIAIAMVAATVSLDEQGRIDDARIAVGACSPVAKRLRTLETRIFGRSPEAAGAALTDADFDELDPIDDIRASADYRRHAARVLVSRALSALSVAAAA